MAFNQLKSTNTDLGFIIKKNPASPMVIKKNRRGHLFGYFSKDSVTQYNLYFKDSPSEVSYPLEKNATFEYMNTTRYNSSLSIINMVGELLKSAVALKDERDVDNHTHTYVINSIEISNKRQLGFFKKHFFDFEFEYNQIVGKTYQIVIKTTLGIYELLNMVNLFALFNVLYSKEYIDMNDSAVMKYLKAIQAVKAPFFIRYLFNRNFLGSKQTFKKFKEDLEKNSNDKIEMAFGDTATQRKLYLERSIDFSKPIIDIGCGEGFYGMQFAKKAPSYLGLDIDESVLEVFQRKIKKNNGSNISLFNSMEDLIDEAKNEEQYEIIIAEVIEHMPLDEAESLLKYVLGNFNASTIIITTPNADFNQFYLLEDDVNNGFRHDDHDWEMNKNDFVEWMNNLLTVELSNRLFDWEFVDIGDRVNGISTSQAVVIKEKV